MGDPQRTLNSRDAPGARPAAGTAHPGCPPAPARGKLLRFPRSPQTLMAGASRSGKWGASQSGKPGKSLPQRRGRPRPPRDLPEASACTGQANTHVGHSVQCLSVQAVRSRHKSFKGGGGVHMPLPFVRARVGHQRERVLPRVTQLREGVRPPDRGSLQDAPLHHHHHHHRSPIPAWDHQASHEVCRARPGSSGPAGLPLSAGSEPLGRPRGGGGGPPAPVPRSQEAQSSQGDKLSAEAPPFRAGGRGGDSDLQQMLHDSGQWPDGMGARPGHPSGRAPPIPPQEDPPTLCRLRAAAAGTGTASSPGTRP